MKGRDLGLIKVLSQNSPGESEENDDNLSHS